MSLITVRPSDNNVDGLTVGSKYHKIHALYKRGEKGLFTSEFSKPEFDYLYYSVWRWTEKVDGTNIRVGLNKNSFEIRGKSDRAQLPLDLMANINKMFTDRLTMKHWGTAVGDAPITLYGEGYGAGIQKAGVGYGPDKKFILFDARRDKLWLTRLEVEEIAGYLDIPIVPEVLVGSIAVAIDYIEHKPKSLVAQGSIIMEGVVGVPLVPLANQWGERVIIKIKGKDHPAKEGWS